MIDTLKNTTMTTHKDNIDSTTARALLMADYRVRYYETTKNGVKVALANGYNFRVGSDTDELGYVYKQKRTFVTHVAAAHALDNIVTDEEADMEIAEAAWEYRTMTNNR